MQHLHFISFHYNYRSDSISICKCAPMLHVSSYTLSGSSPRRALPPLAARVLAHRCCRAPPYVVDWGFVARSGSKRAAPRRNYGEAVVNGGIEVNPFALVCRCEFKTLCNILVPRMTPLARHSHLCALAYMPLCMLDGYALQTVACALSARGKGSRP